MLLDCESLMDEYWSWLKERTIWREVDGWTEITTPYLDRHNDYLQIYARSDGYAIILTDDSYILDDLEMSGCPIDTPRRRSLLQTTLNGFGVRSNGNALEIAASPGDFALKKHSLLQAMLAVDNLFYLASPIVMNLFIEDVTEWLDSYSIRYTPNIKLSGSSGYDHVFDFIIPKSARRPERILQTINHPDKKAVQAMVFFWVDTKDVRPEGSQAYAILNDTDRPTPGNVIEAMRSHEIHPVPWSNRRDSEEALTS